MVKVIIALFVLFFLIIPWMIGSARKRRNRRRNQEAEARLLHGMVLKAKGKDEA